MKHSFGGGELPLKHMCPISRLCSSALLNTFVDMDMDNVNRERTSGAFSILFCSSKH